jgi:GNAT superfamily N-acetyltransferase
VLEPPDPLDLPKALDHLEAAGVPFVLHVGGDLPDVIRQAPALGLSDEGRLPCLALEQCELPPPAPGITIERVDRARWDGFTDVLAAGFGTPRSIPASLLPPGVLDHDQLRAYVGTVDGQPVATAVSVRTGKTIGIYAVATMPAARGRGFGTAMTWHTLADADPGWDIAVLQASEMGRPVYERMGFRQVREFAELVGGPEG